MIFALVKTPKTYTMIEMFGNESQYLSNIIGTLVNDWTFSRKSEMDVADIRHVPRLHGTLITSSS